VADAVEHAGKVRAREVLVEQVGDLVGPSLNSPKIGESWACVSRMSANRSSIAPLYVFSCGTTRPSPNGDRRTSAKNPRRWTVRPPWSNDCMYG
jgi:hypothetical protein